METAFFNFSVKENKSSNVYSTALLSIIFSTTLLLLPVFVFLTPISELLQYTDNKNYIIWVALIIATDALMAIPFARLRQENKAMRFATIKMITIFINVFINLFILGLCKGAHDNAVSEYHNTLGQWYNPEIGIGYIFLANLVSNVAGLVMLLPQYKLISYAFDITLWKKMMRYALPLMIVGFSGMINETFDRVLLKYILPSDIAMEQVGIYSACYKIAIIMTIFIQAFRYAAEPFFFSQSDRADAKSMYANVMTWFAIAGSFIFLATMSNISWIMSIFLSTNYRSGIDIVPILLMANLFLGIYYNLSIWYKLTGKTGYGMLLTLIGVVVTLAINIIWIPVIGYFASAWATIACYSIMMIISFAIGNKHYPVDYDHKRIWGYIALSLALYVVQIAIKTSEPVLNLVINNCILLFYLGLILVIEKNSIIKSLKNK